jgi:penicillin amidase
MKKIIAILAVALIILLAVAGFVAWRTVSSPWPKTNGELSLPGLQEQVTVIRDKRGIPHIYASNTHDLFMAQGYVHAQDRFWQMEFWRRIGAGRLSEIFGESQVETDRFLRTMGIVPAAERTWEAVDDETRSTLEAYAEGVNAYIDQNKDDLPMEFKVLGLTGVKFTPEPWKPLDTITWSTMMAFDLGGNYKHELRRAQLMDRYGEAWMHELMDIPYDEHHPSIVPTDVAWDKLGLETTVASLPGGLMLGSGDGVGSNNWVVAGEHTETGMPLLANDPHLSIQMPAIWYENGLHCQPAGPDCPYDIVGFSFASVPGVIIGHNQRIAWGVTNTGPDVQDLYVERINPDNPNQYEVNGQWRDMDIHQEEIKVAGKDEPVIITVRSTRHGPIINDVAFGPGSDWAYGWQPLALQWTAIGTNRLPQSILTIDRATDWDSFREGLQYWDAPAQNFVYADMDGNIGYQMPGLIPIRAQGDGGMPVPGWNDDYAWTGFIPFDELPRSFNPEQGYLITANNRVIGPDYPYFISKEWAPGYRAQRIEELITSKDKLGVADFQKIHGDNANLLARAIIPTLAEVPLERSEVAAMRDRLTQWDVQQNKDSVETVFFETFYYHLIPAIYEDELADMAPHPSSSAKSLIETLMSQPDSHWWDNVTTPGIETENDILAQALNEAYDDLIERVDKNPDKWRWGPLHTATFRNQTLGESGVGFVEAIFNRGPFETGGGGAIINATSWGGEEPNPFNVVWLPSMRMIVDMADLNRSLTINTTGQSGHPYNKHYIDQAEDWAAIAYQPMFWDRAQLEAQAEGTLTLTPGK